MARNEKGQFMVGHVGGPGRPVKNAEQQYFTAVTDVVTVEDWQVITRKAVEQARNGNKDARSWLTKILIPAPEIVQKLIVERESKEKQMDLTKLADDELATLEKIMAKACSVESVSH